MTIKWAGPGQKVGATVGSHPKYSTVFHGSDKDTPDQDIKWEIKIATKWLSLALAAAPIDRVAKANARRLLAIFCVRRILLATSMLVNLGIH